MARKNRRSQDRRAVARLARDLELAVATQGGRRGVARSIAKNQGVTLGDVHRARRVSVV